MKPFLKWVGGKNRLLSTIEKKLPHNISEYDTYIEPFIGGGAVFFHLHKKYRFANVHISDTNAHLILCYRRLQDSHLAVISALSELVSSYPSDPDLQPSYFYDVRSRWNSALDVSKLTPAQQCVHVAEMIFLNKTCFNGLFRLNRKGEFNSSFGRYTKPPFPTSCDLKLVSELLAGVHIHHAPFHEVAEKYVKGKTFVYFDPPYRPISQTSKFVSYSAEDFDDDDQVAVAATCKKLDQQKVSFMLSNSDPKNTVPDDDFFDVLYADFSIMPVEVCRTINNRGTKRGRISEILVTNY